LAKLILGSLKPTAGAIVRHPLLKIGYFSQHSVEELTSAPPSSISPLSGVPVATTALSYFMWKMGEQGIKVEERDARACLGSFGLQGRIASDTPLKALSGGQKVRREFISYTNVH
jgi:ATP-binding cassette, subfamily F, member 3